MWYVTKSCNTKTNVKFIIDLYFFFSPILNRRSSSRKEKKRKPDSEMSASSDQEEESSAKRRKTAASKQSAPHRNTSSSVIGSPKSMTSPQRDKDNETKKRTTRHETNSVCKRLNTGTENVIAGPVGKDNKNTSDEKIDSMVVIPKLVGYDISSTEDSEDVPSESTEKEQLTDDKIDTTSEDKSVKNGVQPEGKKEMKTDKSKGSQSKRPLKSNSKKTTVQSPADASNVKVKPETRRTRKTRRSEEENCLPEDKNGTNSDGTKKATRRSLRTRKS